MTSSLPRTTSPGCAAARSAGRVSRASTPTSRSASSSDALVGLRVPETRWKAIAQQASRSGLSDRLRVTSRSAEAFSGALQATLERGPYLARAVQHASARTSPPPRAPGPDRDALLAAARLRADRGGHGVRRLVGLLRALRERAEGTCRGARAGEFPGRGRNGRERRPPQESRLAARPIAPAAGMSIFYFDEKGKLASSGLSRGIRVKNIAQAAGGSGVARRRRRSTTPPVDRGHAQLIALHVPQIGGAMVDVLAASGSSRASWASCIGRSSRQRSLPRSPERSPDCSWPC